MAAGPVTQDAYGHLQNLAGPNLMTAAANAVTTPGTIAVATAGIIAHVSFSQPYANVPAVQVNVANSTPANVAAAAVAVTVNGFDVYAGAAISVGANAVSYVVIP